MINVHDNYWIPSDGFNYLTDGSSISDQMYLGAGADINDWWDTNDPAIPGAEDKAEAYDILIGGTE